MKKRRQSRTFIELPCNVGDTVYMVDTFEREIVECSFNLNMLRYIDEFVFLTKVKAKNSLKKLENLQIQHIKTYLKYSGVIQ